MKAIIRIEVTAAQAARLIRKTVVRDVRKPIKDQPGAFYLDDLARLAPAALVEGVRVQNGVAGV